MMKKWPNRTRGHPPIDRFIGEYRFLSSFYPVIISFEELLYPSIEHAYQASKTLEIAARKVIAALHKPGKAKKEGQRLTLRYDWENVKIPIMENLIRQKFSNHNAGLRRQLISTGDAELIEGNTWNDTFWGICQGEGTNHLGRLLMQVREEVQENEQR